MSTKEADLLRVREMGHVGGRCQCSGPIALRTLKSGLAVVALAAVLVGCGGHHGQGSAARTIVPVGTISAPNGTTALATSSAPTSLSKSTAARLAEGLVATSPSARAAVVAPGLGSVNLGFAPGSLVTVDTSTFHLLASGDATVLATVASAGRTTLTWNIYLAPENNSWVVLGARQ
jgi:hypothetical protein